MRITAGTIVHLAGALGLALAPVLQGCGAGAAANAPQIPAAAPTPRPLSDLSALSAASSTGNPFDSHADRLQDALGLGRSASRDKRTFLEKPGASRQVGPDWAPGEAQLLNAKAARFANFSNGLLDHVFQAARDLQNDERVAHLRLPDELRRVVITAILNKDGRLHELIVEQRSGQATMDKFMIRALKKGLWYNNPPPEALTPAGNYRLRIEGKLKNYASLGHGVWRFKTFLGIAIQ